MAEHLNRFGRSQWAISAIWWLALNIIFVPSIGISQPAPAVPVTIDLPEVAFTDPDEIVEGNKGASFLKQITAMIEAVPSGEEITVCVFKFSNKKLARTLIQAEDRGVEVRVIMNQGKTSDKDNKEVSDLFRKELDEFYFLNNNLSKKSIIHNKFILFSEIVTPQGTVNNLVLQTSSNFQAKSARKLQDLLILQDRELYFGYLNLWFDLKVLGLADKFEEFKYYDVKSSTPGIKAYFYPKNKEEIAETGDEVLNSLRAIKDYPNTTVRFAHGKWQKGREEIIKALADLADKGVSVEIVTNDDVDEDIKDQLNDLDSEVIFLDPEINMHTKFFLIEEANSKTVWTGSHNLTKRSLRRNFEVLLEVRDDAIFDKYLAYFEEIKKLK